MTMSVGLARIQNDPEGSPMVRKALGALSTPGLLVHDTGLSIDDDGRIIIRLNPNGGLIQNEDGLSLAITVGIESHVDLVSDEYDREWNARLTGTAPNFFEGSVAIGTEDLDGIAPGIVAEGASLDHPKVNITHTLTQLRLSHDPANFVSMRTTSGGKLELFSIGEGDTGFAFVSGDGTRDGARGGVTINGGTVIEQIFAFFGTVSWAGGGTIGSISWAEFNFDTTNLSPPFTVRPTRDFVSVCVYDSSIPSVFLSWSAYVNAFNIVTVRVTWYDVWPAQTIRWLFKVTKLQA